MARFSRFHRVGQTLYKVGRKYFRLFGHGITPNGCWLIGAFLRELVNIDAATGRDVYGAQEVRFGEGEVPAGAFLQR